MIAAAPSKSSKAGSRMRWRRPAGDAIHRLTNEIAELEGIEREHRELSGMDDPAGRLRDLRARRAQLEVSLREQAGTLAGLGADQKRLADQRRALATRSAID